MLDDLKVIYKSVKRINIKVKPTLEVILTVPLGTSDTEINLVLAKRKAWIVKHLEYFSKFKQPHQSKQLISGEEFSYLGRSYRLKVSPADVTEVKLIGGYLHLNLPDHDNHDKKLHLIEKWYKKRAVELFNQLISKYIPVVDKQISRVSIRKMKTRWGSCNPRKSYINLNLELIKKHPQAIEYVILHELTHLIHYHHDKSFYNFLATHMPDWQLRQKKLYSYYVKYSINR